MKVVSSVPFAFSLAILFTPVVVLTALPFTLVKPPPIKILPSGCTAMLNTSLFSKFGPWLNVLSSVPTALSRASFFTLLSPFTMVATPPIKILPSACTATACRVLAALAVKVVSTLRSGLSRAILMRATPLRVSNEPTAMILPSGSTAVSLTSERTTCPNACAGANSPAAIARDASAWRNHPAVKPRGDRTVDAQRGLADGAMAGTRERRVVNEFMGLEKKGIWRPRFMN